jgi:hypothetical protein
MRTAPGTDPVRLIGLKIDFLSPVTKPAHEGAVAVLLKRRHGKPSFLTDGKKAKPSFLTDDDDDAKKKKRRKVNPCADAAKLVSRDHRHAHSDQLEKFGDDVPTVMTSSVGGHSHLVQLDARAGTTTWQKAEDSEGSHDHPFMLTVGDDGTFSLVIGDADGHTHATESSALNAAFAAAALSKLFDSDPQEDDMTTTKTAEEIQALETNLALAQIFTSFDDGTRDFFETLDESGKVAFVGKNQKQRASAITKAAKAAEKAAGADEVVYTDSLGHKFTKADDVRMVAAAKRADDSDKRAQKFEDERDQERLEKRAETELAHLPGTAKTRASLLKMVDDIEDEDEREATLKVLLAGNAAIGKGFDSIGTQAVEDELGIEANTSGGKLEKAVQKWADDHKVTEAQAYADFTKTEEGRRLYAESVN